MANPTPRRRRSLLFPLLLVLLAVLVFTAGVVLATSPIAPPNWKPDPAPALEREFTPNGALAATDRIAVGAPGPEDVAVMPDGTIVVGVGDGRLLRGTIDGGLDTWVDTGGRPIGMDVGPGGNLVVAVADRGLVEVTPDGQVRDLLNSVATVPLRFADDVDVASDGSIYFSVASDRFAYDDWELDVIEGGGNGALYRLEPDGSVQTLLQNLHFANGVAVAEDESFVLVAESTRYRVRRVWLSGSRAPSSEILIDNLPGFPDGVSAAADGTFWLALAMPRSRLLDALAPAGPLRHLVAAIPSRYRPTPDAAAHVVNFDADGRIIESLDDRSDGAFGMITSVEPVGDVLYLGSLQEHAFGRYRCGCEGSADATTADRAGEGSSGAEPESPADEDPGRPLPGGSGDAPEGSGDAPGDAPEGSDDTPEGSGDSPGGDALKGSGDSPGGDAPKGSGDSPGGDAPKGSADVRR